MEKKKKIIKIFKSRYFIILIIFLILGLGINWSFWYFSPEIKQSRQYKKDAEVLIKKIQEQEQKYAVDTYGGETPEETYGMFLQALKNQDIDLASKYFILDKQETYKQFFTDIKNNDKWDEMMEDLLNPRNQEGKLEDENTYVIEIISDQNISVATIVLRRPQSSIGIEKKLLSDVWKIVEF